MNLLRHLAGHLEFCGFGKPDENIFWGRMPDSPDACVCLFSADSGLPGRDAGDTVRVVNRASSPGEAYETACAIAQALDGFDGFLAGEGALARIEVLSGASGMGADGKKRELYTIELRMRYCGE